MSRCLRGAPTELSFQYGVKSTYMLFFKIIQVHNDLNLPQIKEHIMVLLTVSH